MKSSDKEKIFLDILEKHRNQIYRISWGFTSISEDVEDLYQEIMINIWKGLDGFRSDATVSTWLHKVAINTCILWKKKKQKHNADSSIIPDEMTTPEQTFPNEENETVLQLRKAIQELKKMDKSIMLLLLEGLSYHEIAEVTGFSPSNVGVRINRIKAKLRTSIKI